MLMCISQIALNENYYTIKLLLDVSNLGVFNGVRTSSKETVAPPNPTCDSRLVGVASITNGGYSRQNRFLSS